MTVDQQVIDDIIKQTRYNLNAQPAAIAPAKNDRNGGIWQSRISKSLYM